MARNRYTSSTRQLSFSCGLLSKGLTQPLQGGELGRVWLSVAFEGPSAQQGRDFCLQLLDRKLSKVAGSANWSDLNEGLQGGAYTLQVTNTGNRDGFTLWWTVAGVMPLWLASWVFGMLPVVRDQTQARVLVSSSNPQFNGVRLN